MLAEIEWFHAINVQPDLACPVLIVIKFDNGGSPFFVVDIGWYLSGGMEWQQRHTEAIVTVTHWAYMPDMPPEF